MFCTPTPISAVFRSSKKRNTGVWRPPNEPCAWSAGLDARRHFVTRTRWLSSATLHDAVERLEIGPRLAVLKKARRFSTETFSATAVAKNLLILGSFRLLD